MAISIPTPLIEFILFGPLDDRRQLQDSPILGDVWIRYGTAPAAAVDLLIAPFAGDSSSKVASAINRSLPQDATDRQVAYLQGFVVAKLRFSELIRFVVPRTKWWNKNRKLGTKNTEPTTTADHTTLKAVSQLLEMSAPELATAIDDVFALARSWRQSIAGSSSPDDTQSRQAVFQPKLQRLQEMPPLQRFVALTGLILWAGEFEPGKRASTKDPTDFILQKLNTKSELSKATKLVASLRDDMLKKQPDDPDKADVWEVSVNRSALPALVRSIPAVKADAARTLFSVDCSNIAWAVIDSGIDGTHPAFFTTGDPATCRIKQSFDFHNFRKIISLSNLVDHLRAKNVETLMATRETLVEPPDFDSGLKQLAQDAEDGRPIHWELVRQFVQIKPETPPSTNHGTHVAGILGASKKAGESTGSDAADGMCPDIRLFDFRVISPDIRDSEFAIIAVLQFIRYLNSQDNFLKIHGANLSISIPHDVRNYACGRTPICVECERLIESGVVVIAAAGNHGYKTFQTNEGAFDSYAAFSITDPGNADAVLTVGSTHRFWPHTYGVSFFSSRGPTGDGRMKPDLVAPGERIRAPFPNRDWGDLDGTSMAAPHVSGAAAMLMARYSELVGHPRRIKQILCESATNLERERSFQGYGMLDVLRAFQSI